MSPGSSSDLYSKVYIAKFYMMNQNWNQSRNKIFWQWVSLTVNWICISSAALYQSYKNSPKSCYSYRSDTDMRILI